ncbi:hypothetical protein TELCIR_09396 [Teladorsagia circumcincta]|uniref:Uncharacterized protein n=1 Tax=Teladorsagia circumcincta TaxID=45464 RepID=A0A2G9UF04_TELCI|nr:hypothetical protein TELCIR_09396 [Teladorsagia circumcincta]
MVSDNESLLSEPYVVDMPRTQVLCDVYNQGRSSQGLQILIPVEYSSTRDAHSLQKIETCLLPGRSNTLMFLLDVWRPRGIPYPVFPPSGRTIRVARVDIAARLIYPSFYVYVNPDLRSVIQVKQLIGSMFGDGQRAAVASRLVLERDTQPNGLVLLDSPATNFAELLQQCFSGVPLVYCDSGSKGDSVTEVEEDRRKPLNESIMFAVLDRKKFAQVLLVELPPQDEITRAQAASHAYSGPAWTEVMSTSQPAMSPNVSDVDEGIDDSYSSSFGSFVKGSAAEELLESQGGTRSVTESSDVTPVPVGNTPSSDSSRSIVELTSSTGNLLYLDIDSRLPLEKLKGWLGQKLSIDPTQFVLIKHYREDDKGYECNNKDEENIRSALDNVFKLGIKLRPPLKDDEKLIRIVQFDLEEPNVDERLIGQPGVPLLVRRFRPSTVEVSGIHEVLVDPKATNQMESFARSVSSLSGIPVDRLVFTEVRSCAIKLFVPYPLDFLLDWQLLGEMAIRIESVVNAGRSRQVFSSTILCTE